MLFTILVPVVQVTMNANYGFSRGGWLAQAANRSGWLPARSQIWNFGARRAGRRRVRRGGRFKRGGGKSRRACLMGTHPEKKFKDVAAITVSPAATAQFVLLSEIDQGATESDRVGRKAIITDILVKGHMLISSATAAPPVGNNRIRIDVVQDTQPNALIFAGTTYLATDDINSYMNLTNASRFKTLYSKTTTVNPSAACGNGTTNFSLAQYRNIHINLKTCIEMEYKGTGNGVADQTTNSIYLLAWEEASAPSTALHLYSRIRFVE